MKCYKTIVLTLLICAQVVMYNQASASEGYIDIRLSYKIILNPDDGDPPPLIDITGARLQQTVDAMNDLMTSYQRGYRFVLVEFRLIGGLGDTGPSEWYNLDLLDVKGELEAEAKSNSAYRWNSTAINIYINNGTNRASCSFPGDDIIVMGDNSEQHTSRHLHEIGHYFDLCHTQGCTADDDDDYIDDTLKDSGSWDQDDIAENNPLSSDDYDLLSVSEQNLVDDVWLNIMSYHNNVNQLAPFSTSSNPSRDRLTEEQLDTWTDIANSYLRNDVVDGFTRFVGGHNYWPTTSPEGRIWRNPHETVQEAFDDTKSSSKNHDIILLRPGNYNEVLTLDCPVVLRATRDGSATIGL